MTAAPPSSFGRTRNPGVNISVDFELSLINLHSGESWSQQRQGENWQRLQLSEGSSDRGERQLLTTLSDPLKQFLVRVAPPPTLEGRHFDRSGD